MVDDKGMQQLGDSQDEVILKIDTLDQQIVSINGTVMINGDIIQMGSGESGYKDVLVAGNNKIIIVES